MTGARCDRRAPLLAAALALGACHPRAAAPVDADGDGVVAQYDCDDADPAVQQWVTAYADADGDGIGAGPAVRMCTDGFLPQGYSPYGSDCAPDDAATWRALVNPAVDRDGDGYTAFDGVTLCVGATVPPPYAENPRGLDCDDSDPALVRWVTLYRDRDGDGLGAGPRTAPWTCIGAAVPAGFSTVGYDANDADPARGVDPAEGAVLAIVLD